MARKRSIKVGKNWEPVETVFWIPIEDLKIDTSYQRDLKKNRHAVGIHVKHMDDAEGVLKVGQRRDGSLWVIDGQQRMWYVFKFGKISIKCEVIPSDGPEQEAKLYRILNEEKTSMTQGEIYKAGLVAKDYDAVQVLECLMKHGFMMSIKRPSVRQWGEVSCAGLLMDIVRDDGKERLDEVLRVAKLWFDDPSACEADPLRGVNEFFKDNLNVIQFQMCKFQFPKFTIMQIDKQVKTLIKNGKFHQSWRKNAFALVLSKIYNEGSPRIPLSIMDLSKRKVAKKKILKSS